MADENLTVPPRVGDLDPEDVTLEPELVDEDAGREIDKAVRGRRGIARKYVKWVRRQNPDATPAEIISMLEHHYVTAISAAGAAITVGSIAAEVGIAMIPVVGAAAAGTKAVAKEAGKKAAKEPVKVTAKETAKAAAKSTALGAAKSGVRRVIPAGDKQLQFEITAVFALAVADIHGMDYDQDQAHALVYGLSNDQVSQQQIATMASDLARCGCWRRTRTRRSRSWRRRSPGRSSATPSSQACKRSAASPARRQSRSPAGSCWNA